MKERLICASGDLIDGSKGVRFEVPDPWKVGAASSGRFRPDGLPADGTATAMAPAFAIRFRGQVRAYLNRCGHVPIELDWQQGEFFDYSGLYLICSTHGALYAPESGRCLGGRCNGKGLQKLAVTEHDGQVFLIEEGKASG